MTDLARVNATLDRELLARVDDYAARQREDRSTAIRQLLDHALRELARRDAVDAYREGRLTLREFASALGLDVWSAHDLLASERIAIAQGTAKETAGDLAALLAELRPRRPRKRPRAPDR